MKTYNQLTKDQKQAAFNYHLNSLLDIPAIPDNPADAEPWTNHDEAIAKLAPTAQAFAEIALYGDDDATGILPVLAPTAPKEEIDNAFFLGQFA